MALHESGVTSADSIVTLPFDAPDRWWIEVGSSASGEWCDLEVIDTESGETLISYAAYHTKAAEMTVAGSLQIVASGPCGLIRAVTDQSLLTTPITELVAGPAQVWMPRIWPDGWVGVGESILMMNHGETAGDLTGWSLEGETFSYQFPAGFTIEPEQETFLHARCGTDTATELHFCLEGDVFGSHEMTLYDAKGVVIDGFSEGCCS